MECLDIALQAPTGSNRQGWQWMFVDDPAKKQALRRHLPRRTSRSTAQLAARPTYESGDPRADRWTR